MSQTTTPEAVPAQPPEHIPQESLAAEENEDATRPLEAGQPPPEPPEEKPAVDAEAERQKTERRREAQRIAHLTKARYQEQARAQAAEQRAQELEQRLRQFEQPAGQPQQLTQQDIDRLAEQRAAQFVTERERQSKINEWDRAGREQLGDAKFAEACKTVADMADDNQKRALLAVAMDVEGGQRAIVQMADDAALAERVLSLPPHLMALEISKLGAPPPAPPKPASTLPPPIKAPAVGRASGVPDPNGSWSDYQKWSAKQPWRR